MSESSASPVHVKAEAHVTIISYVYTIYPKQLCVKNALQGTEYPRPQARFEPTMFEFRVACHTPKQRLTFYAHKIKNKLYIADKKKYKMLVFKGVSLEQSVSHTKNNKKSNYKIKIKITVSEVSMQIKNSLVSRIIKKNITADKTVDGWKVATQIKYRLSKF